MRKSIKIIILISILLFSAITMCSIFSRIFKTTSQLTVDFNSPEGEITYGGTGFLYGIAEPNVPNGNILKGLKPKREIKKKLTKKLRNGHQIVIEAYFQLLLS